MLGVLENGERDVALKLAPRAPPPPAAAGATLTVTQYREQFALPPLLHAIQRGSLGRYALAPLVRAVHVPDGSSLRSLESCVHTSTCRLLCAARGASLQCRADEFRCASSTSGELTCRPFTYLCDGVPDCAADVDELLNYTCGARQLRSGQ